MASYFIYCGHEYFNPNSTIANVQNEIPDINALLLRHALLLMLFPMCILARFSAIANLLAAAAQKKRFVACSATIFTGGSACVSILVTRANAFDRVTESVNVRDRKEW